MKKYSPSRRSKDSVKVSKFVKADLIPSTNTLNSGLAHCYLDKALVCKLPSWLVDIPYTEEIPML